MKKHYFYKSTLPNGRTYYAISEQNPTIEKYLNKELSIVKALQNGTSTPYNNPFRKEIISLNLKNPKSEIKVELLGVYDDKDEVKKIQQDLIEKDPNALNSSKGKRKSSDSKKSPNKPEKSEPKTPSYKGDIKIFQDKNGVKSAYVNTNDVEKYPNFNFDMLDKRVENGNIYYKVLPKK
jgi:hypothetical protein